MKTICGISLWTVLSIVSAGLAMAGDEPLLITNKDLPKTPKVSVLGTLKVAEVSPDTRWIDRIDAMVSELETGRQLAPGERYEPSRPRNRDYCAVGASPFVAVVGVERACPYRVCPEGGYMFGERRYFGTSKRPKPGAETPASQHQVDALPEPTGGFAGRPGKHLRASN